MRRLVLSLVTLGVLFVASGCIAANVSGNRFNTDRELVVVRDEVYMVDKCSGTVMKIDVSSAGPFVAESDSE